MSRLESEAVLPDFLREFSWAPEDAEIALESLASRFSLATTSQSKSAQLPICSPEATLKDRLEATASELGLEADSLSVTYGQVDELLRGKSPFLGAITDRGGIRLLAIVHRILGRVSLLAPDGRVRWVRTQTIVRALRRPFEASELEAIEALLQTAGVARRRLNRTRKTLLKDRLEHLVVVEIWRLRVPLSADGRALWREAGLTSALMRFLGYYSLGFACLLASWGVLGREALEGRVTGAWLFGWALLLVGLVPLRMASTWAQAQVTARAGTLLKRRLLQGILRLSPDEIRTQGAGLLLARVVEADALEFYSLQGGFLSVAGMVDLLLSGVVLSAGLAATLTVGSFVAWLGLTAILAYRYYTKRQRWTEERIALSNATVEGLVGYRTRRAQQVADRLHEQDDGAIQRYWRHARDLDRGRAALLSFIPRGWLVVGILAISPEFIAGTNSTGRLALTVGGLLVAFRGFGKLTEGLGHLAGAHISWRQVRLFFDAAARAEQRGQAFLDPGPSHSVDRRLPILQADGLVYRHRSRAQSVLQDCDLTLFVGDKMLIEGGSGGGKSTLISLLSGLRKPDAGIILLSGLDLHTIGERSWRRSVAVVPQFHENHIFTESLAFNLLMGRGWPPAEVDLADAEKICRALKLGALLERMPSGLNQLVGDTGWQLSHGEKSRVFIARALLQQPRVVILDESLAALDPKTGREVLACILEHSPTLLLVAHP